MVTGEVSRTPAVYGSSDVLSGGDEYSTEYEEWYGVAMMKSVHEVIVVASV